MIKKINVELIRKIGIVLSIFGILLAGYLLSQYYTQQPVGICNINSKFNCDAITQTELGYIFGIPIAVVGLVGYVSILFFLAIKNFPLSLFMSAFGFFFCLRVTILEIFFVKVACPVCILCQINMAILFGLTSFLYLQARPREKK